MFEKALRLKLRFESRGNLTVEDLWDLPLTSKTGVSLDDLAIKYNKIVKESEDLSFVVELKKNDTDRLRLDILKHIIKVKLEEREKAKQEVENKAEKERLLAILARKESEEDEQLSKEQLRKKIEKLG